MLKPRHIVVALLAACTAVPFSLGAGAEPLEPDECKALEAKKRGLLTPKVQSALTRGPDWVKDNLHDQEQIEKIREYLMVEETVAFRCRTDGVRIPKPLPPPLPDRKPPVPTILVQGTPKVLAGVAATSFLPLRKPSLAASASETVTADAPPEEGAGGEGDVASAADDAGPQAGPSQTVSDSDKTAPSEN